MQGDAGSMVPRLMGIWGPEFQVLGNWRLETAHRAADSDISRTALFIVIIVDAIVADAIPFDNAVTVGKLRNDHLFV